MRARLQAGSGTGAWYRNANRKTYHKAGLDWVALGVALCGQAIRAPAFVLHPHDPTPYGVRRCHVCLFLFGMVS